MAMFGVNQANRLRIQLGDKATPPARPVLASEDEVHACACYVTRDRLKFQATCNCADLPGSLGGFGRVGLELASWLGS